MKEDMLQNDKEDIRQENTSASGNVAENDVIDQAEDEWHDAGSDGYVTERIPEGLMPFLKIAVPVACAALLILLLVIAGLSGKKTEKMEMKESYVSSTPRQETLTEAEEAKPAETAAGQMNDGNAETQVSTENSKEAEEMTAMATALEEAETQYQFLYDMVFGENGRSNSLGCVTAVTGFTDREKREIGFLEADFLKEAGAFLASQQIQTKRIIIEDRIAGSSNAAVAFQGRLEGKDDYILDMVFYPDLPGEYIFLLRNVKGNERENGGGTTTESVGQNAGGNSSQAQNAQNNTPVQEVSQPAAAQQNTQPAAQPQNSYDATNLSVKKIPETLLNYLDNRYEFQYDLYDWLYRHGKREVSSAAVTDYSIDGDSRTATIELVLSDGSSVTAVYNKSSNTYSFER